MKKLLYPVMEGAGDIVGWTDQKGRAYTIAVGDVIEVDDDAASVLQRTYPFLELTEKIPVVREVVRKPPVIKKEVKIVKEKKEKAKPIVEKKEKKEEASVYECEECKRVCKSFRGLIAHRRTHEKAKV